VWRPCCSLWHFAEKQPAVKYTKLRGSPDPACNSWRASNVLCHHRQMDISVTYTYNLPPCPVVKIAYARPPSYLAESMDAFSAPPMHQWWGHTRPQPWADRPVAGSVLLRVCEKSRVRAPAGQANRTDDLWIFTEFMKQFGAENKLLKLTELFKVLSLSWLWGVGHQYYFSKMSRVCTEGWEDSWALKYEGKYSERKTLCS